MQLLVHWLTKLVKTSDPKRMKIGQRSPIDSRFLHSGPHIALKVEEISESSLRKPNSPIQGKEPNAVTNKEQLSNLKVDTQREVADCINYRKQNKTIIRNESISSSEFSYTHTDSEREYTEDSEENIEILNSDIRTRREKQSQLPWKPLH